MFLGIPIGFNLRRKEVSKPLLSKLRRRLLGWQNINLSIGGRVPLLNALLYNILVFIFSFHKAQKCIIKEIISIQKYFLWGGFDEEKKIRWISWSKVYFPEK